MNRTKRIEKLQKLQIILVVMLMALAIFEILTLTNWIARSFALAALIFVSIAAGLIWSANLEEA